MKRLDPKGSVQISLRLPASDHARLAKMVKSKNQELEKLGIPGVVTVVSMIRFLVREHVQGTI